MKAELLDKYFPSQIDRSEDLTQVEDEVADDLPIAQTVGVGS